ncbi:MAG: ABC transporter permease subunit [Anaerolineales bacterium]|jgi:putative spermidine/putrescine transport system permease protein
MMDSLIIKRNSSLKKWSIWLPLLPFFIFAFLFEIIPVISVLLSSLGNDFYWLTLDNYRRAMTPLILRSFINTIRLSATTAAIGVVLGTLISHALVNTRNKYTHNSVMALADVATNFGGAPLAFAFIVTLGSTGVITLILKNLFNISLYPDFRIYSITGLTLAYLYFQIPLMILLIQPSILGLKSDWKEAASTLGASNWHYWKRIGLPILAPSLIGGFLLLFAHSFGAYATAWTLTGPDINLVTIQIAALIRGEVQLEPGIADAMAIISLLIMMLCVAGYQWASTRAAKWRT